MSWAIFLGIVTVSLGSAVFKLEEENCFYEKTSIT